MEREKCGLPVTHWQGNMAGRDTVLCSSGQSISTCHFTVCKKWWSQDAVNVRRMNSCCLYDISLAYRTMYYCAITYFAVFKAIENQQNIPDCFSAFFFCFKLKYKIVQANNDQIKTCYWVLSYLLHCAVFL